jgi:hypothetical protein
MPSIIQVENIFEPEFAKLVAEEMIIQQEKGESVYKSYPYSPDGIQKEQGIINSIENREAILKEIEFVKQDYIKNNKFSRSYYFLKPDKIMKQSIDILENDFFANLITKKTGITNLKLATLEFYIYEKDGFLAPHYDITQNNRVITTIIYLNENWKKEDGGLYMYSDAENDPVNVFVPKFNSMLITNISTKTHLHGVSFIKTNKRRLTITCSWSKME